MAQNTLVNTLMIKEKAKVYSLKQMDTNMMAHGKMDNGMAKENTSIETGLIVLETS